MTMLAYAVGILAPIVIFALLFLGFEAMPRIVALWRRVKKGE